MPTHINRRRFLTQAGLVAGGVVAGPSLLAACGGGGGGGGETDTFKVGAVLELSGASATGGQIAQRGYQLWADTVNKAGGLSIGDTKYNVELVVQDCQERSGHRRRRGHPAGHRGRVNAMFGAYTSGVQLAMDPICAKYRIPCIAGSAESPNVWKAKPEFTFGVIPAVDTHGGARRSRRSWTTANPKPTTAAVVGANEPFSDNTAEGFRAGAESAGLNVVHYSLFPPNSDLAPVAGAVAAQRPDIVAVGGHDILLVDFVKAMAATGFTPKAIIEHYGITDASFAKALGRASRRRHGDLGLAADRVLQRRPVRLGRRLREDIRASHGSPPDYTAAGCSAAGQVLQAGVEKLGEPPSLSEESRRQAERTDRRHRPGDLLREDPVRNRGRPLPQQHRAGPDAGPDPGRGRSRRSRRRTRRGADHLPAPAVGLRVSATPLGCFVAQSSGLNCGALVEKRWQEMLQVADLFDVVADPPLELGWR